jgi:hypothetical protein
LAYLNSQRCTRSEPQSFGGIIPAGQPHSGPYRIQPPVQATHNEIARHASGKDLSDDT